MLHAEVKCWLPIMIIGIVNMEQLIWILTLENSVQIMEIKTLLFTKKEQLFLTENANNLWFQSLNEIEELN